MLAQSQMCRPCEILRSSALVEWVVFDSHLCAATSQGLRKREFVTVWIMHMEEALSPGGVLGFFRIISVFSEMTPERIDVHQVEDDSAPLIPGATLLQVQDWALCLCSA
jgi:hypothetical protein